MDRATAPGSTPQASPPGESRGVRRIASGGLLWFKDAGNRFLDDHATQLGAALAYYAVFAVGPLLLIAISVAGLVFGKDAAENQVVQTLQGYIGRASAQVIQDIVLKSSLPSSGVTGSILGVVLLLFGATGLFGQLDDALNLIWHVPPSKVPGWKLYLRQRFLSLTMVLGAGFLLLVSLIITTFLAVMGRFFSEHLPGGATVWQGINFLFQLLVVSGLFAVIFRTLPRTIDIDWRDVWPAAAVTGVLFTIGKFILGTYIEKGNVGSAYGAAGSLIGVLVWIYYASQILFFGAELTRVYAERFGSRREGARNAVPSSTAPGPGFSPADLPPRGSSNPQTI